MTPEQAAHDTAPVVARLPGRAMTDRATFARGGELGFDGFDFYVGGRGGVLGEAPGEVVAAAFVFFAPALVGPAWERAGAVMARRDAAACWAACIHDWARAHLDDGPDHARLAGLLGRVVAGAGVAGAPLFAGWRTLPEPDDPKALVLHRLNALRELRGALHAAAILTVGLAPIDAIAVRTPGRAAWFGWPEPHPDPEPLRDRWALAEARTDRMLGRHLAVLGTDERAELVSLATEIAAGLG